MNSYFSGLLDKSVNASEILPESMPRFSSALFLRYFDFSPEDCRRSWNDLGLSGLTQSSATGRSGRGAGRDFLSWGHGAVHESLHKEDESADRATGGAKDSVVSRRAFDSPRRATRSYRDSDYATDSHEEGAVYSATDEPASDKLKPDDRQKKYESIRSRIKGDFGARANEAKQAAQAGSAPKDRVFDRQKQHYLSPDLEADFEGFLFARKGHSGRGDDPGVVSRSVQLQRLEAQVNSLRLVEQSLRARIQALNNAERAAAENTDPVSPAYGDDATLPDSVPARATSLAGDSRAIARSAAGRPDGKIGGERTSLLLPPASWEGNAIVPVGAPVAQPGYGPRFRTSDGQQGSPGAVTRVDRQYLFPESMLDVLAVLADKTGRAGRLLPNRLGIANRVHVPSGAAAASLSGAAAGTEPAVPLQRYLSSLRPGNDAALNKYLRFLASRDAVLDSRGPQGRRLREACDYFAALRTNATSGGLSAASETADALVRSYSASKGFVSGSRLLSVADYYGNARRHARNRTGRAGEHWRSDRNELYSGFAASYVTAPIGAPPGGADGGDRPGVGADAHKRPEKTRALRLSRHISAQYQYNRRVFRGFLDSSWPRPGGPPFDQVDADRSRNGTGFAATPGTPTAADSVKGSVADERNASVSPGWLATAPLRPVLAEDPHDQRVSRASSDSSWLRPSNMVLDKVDADRPRTVTEFGTTAGTLQTTSPFQGAAAGDQNASDHPGRPVSAPRSPDSGAASSIKPDVYANRSKSVRSGGYGANMVGKAEIKPVRVTIRRITFAKTTNNNAPDAGRRPQPTMSLEDYNNKYIARKWVIT